MGSEERSSSDPCAWAERGAGRELRGLMKAFI